MSDNWQTVAKELARDYMVFIVDARNHGRSPHLPSMDYPAMAQDLQEFMESQWIFEGTIIGHSMGGKTAMQLALDHPEVVKKLIVIDIAPVNYHPHHLQIIKAMQDLELKKITTRKEIEIELALTIDNSSVVSFIMKNITRKKHGGFQWKLNLDTIATEYPALLLAPQNGESTYDGETLFIKGKQSDYIIDEYATDIFLLFPKAQIKTIEKAGHWVHVDDRKTMLKMIQDFLKITNSR